MCNRLTASIWAVGIVLALCAVPVAAQRGRVPHVRTVHVSAVDRQDAPVTDLTVADLVLREGGDVREILRVQRATAPMRIAIIVDDSGAGIFRAPVAAFVNHLLGRAQFAIRRVIGQAQTVVDYTSEVEPLRAAIGRLGVMAETPEGGRVVEAVFDATKELRGFERPVIVVLTDTHTEYSTLPSQHVLNELQQSGALLYVISVIRRPAAIIPSLPTTADKPADLLDHQLDINRVLGDGPKQSGGRHAEIAGLGGTVPELQEVAAELNHQYLVTYLIPAGEKLNQKLSVSSTRRGISVRAPSRGGVNPP